MSFSLRWGIVGPGHIAGKFVEDLHLVDGAQVYAVGSRDMGRAQAFADSLGVAVAYGSYEALFADEQVDIVYIATPHDSHASLTIAALEAGKHVLCEKPFALNRGEADRMVAAAESSGRFLMEAFWSRFNPAVKEVIARAKGGDLGGVRYLNADFAFPADVPPGSRLFDPALGGGALLDIGVYPLFLAYTVLGVPDRITARMIPHPTGVDLHMGMVLEYPSAMAMLYSGLASRSNMDATISGTKGRIVIEPTWHEADSYRLVPNDEASGDRVLRPKTGRGFFHEIEECHRCIEAGLRESPLWSLNDSLALMGLADRVRECAGLVYPADA